MSVLLLTCLLCLLLYLPGIHGGDGNISLSCPGTTYENQGLVSVSFENSNYHVCFGGFNRGAAAAVCRELGFVDAEIVVHDNPPLYYGTPHSLGCSMDKQEERTDSFIPYAYCPNVSDYFYYGQMQFMRCDVGKIVQVTICSPVTVKCSSAKLSTSVYRYSGMVELDGMVDKFGYAKVNLHGTSNYICCDQGKDVASTICRQLGYTSGTGQCTSTPPPNGGDTPDLYKFDGLKCTSASGSFPCFSHCIDQDHISTTQICQYLTVNCEILLKDVFLLTAGSRSLCMLQGPETLYFYTTIGLGTSFGVTLFLLVIVVTVICKRRVCKYRKEPDEERARLNRPADNRQA